MQNTYKLLPPRSSTKQGTKFSNAHQESFLSNYYQVRLASKNAMIYQYSLETQPPIPKDSTKLLALVTKSIKKDLKEKIGYATASGNMIWGFKQIKIASIHQTEFIQDETPYKFEVIVKPAKEFVLMDVAGKEEYLMMVKQVFNNKLKEKLRSLGMVDLGGGKYYTGKETEHSDFDIKEAGLKVIRGFKFTLASINGINVLNIDVCSRVFRSQSFLQSISNWSKAQIEQSAGSIVITRYGKRKTYRIEEIDFKQSPSSQFYSSKTQGKVTYSQYYNENYGIKIREMKQPLVKVILHTDKKMEKGKLVEIHTYGYLIPELISLTGMSDEQRANHNTMKALAPSTKLTPKERLEETQAFKKKLNDGEQIVGNPRKVVGWNMYEPQILIGPGKLRIERGNLNLKDEVRQPKHFKDWLFVYSNGGKNSKYDDQDADDAVKVMRKAAETFKIRIQTPGFLTVDGRNVNEWIQMISSDIEKNGKPQIIVFLVQRQQENYYGKIKEFLSIKYNVPCQFIRKRTLGQQSKNPMSAASKIVLQMNAKIGGAPWLVGKTHEYFKGRTVMYGGISISKGKNGFTVAFVGSITDDLSKVFSFCKTGIKNKEVIDQALFQKFFTQWAKNYVIKNQTAPSIVLIYREGLSIPQIKLQLNQQVDALQNTMKKIAAKTKNPKYDPEVVYMVCNKKISTRFYAMNGGQGAQQSGGKFRPDISNPAPGSVVMDELSVQNVYDFHLTAQLVTQGTATPTQYIIAFKSDTSTITQDALARFTYDQCYNYYNWSGSVKVPACLQDANKLSKLVGESIGRDVIEGEITKTYYFL